MLFAPFRAVFSGIAYGKSHCDGPRLRSPEGAAVNSPGLLALGSMRTRALLGLSPNGAILSAAPSGLEEAGAWVAGDSQG